MSKTNWDNGIVLVTGGAGFVGCNVAADYLTRGFRVRILDNFSREGVRANLHWLQAQFPGQVDVRAGDVCDRRHLRNALEGVSVVYHFAAQVAVTVSLDDPAKDYRTNVEGTFRLLEAIRQADMPPVLVFASTNKVYGDLSDVPLAEAGRRYVSPALPAISEQRPLDFHTPYGCSKGSADQYVLDYARSYDLPATVLRMSCIYGPHQCGTEDQGWVAHFLIQRLKGQPVHIYGNGKQVRDILYIDDLIEAQRVAAEKIDRLRGKAWNVGGGIDNSVSLLEVLDLIEALTGEAPAIEFHPTRPGDQRYYVSDHIAFTRATGWKPKVHPGDGMQRLAKWYLEASQEEPRLQSMAGGA